MKVFYLPILILWLRCMVSSQRPYPDYNWKPSCKFLDSVNITSGEKLANGSYVYEGVTYPLKHIGVYDHEYLNATVKVPALPHLRGCICKIKTCVRLCCGNSQAFDAFDRDCYQPEKEVNPKVEVTYRNSTIRNVELKSLFGFVYGQPCKESYFLDPTSLDDDRWELFEDGKVLRVYDNFNMTKDEYCFSPIPVENQTLMYLNPLVCFQQPKSNLKFIIYGIGAYISVPFMILTFLVYAVIPDLRNLHGKSLCCYLFSMSLGYSCLGYMLLTGGMDVGYKCKILGSLTYYGFMAGFLWVNIISFDLWWNFRSVSTRDNKKQWKRFLIYSIYSWGLALVFLIIVLVVQGSNIPEEMKPGVGGPDNCFLNIKTWLQFVYFYGQLLATITFNITVFILTLCTIHRVNKEMSTMMAKGESRRSYNQEKAKIMLFLRLFIIMGITWSSEFVSWLVGENYEFVFYITDIFNTVQGLLIFILFVLRKRVKKLVVKKYYSLRGIQRKDSTIVTQSTKSSGIPMGGMERKSHENGKKAEAPLMSTMSDDESTSYSSYCREEISQSDAEEQHGDLTIPSMLHDDPSLLQYEL